MSESIFDMEAYSKLNDTIFNIIEFSSDPNLQKAQELLHRIHTRDLYKFVGQADRNTESVGGKLNSSHYYKQSELPGIKKEILKNQDVIGEDDVVLDASFKLCS